MKSKSLSLLQAIGFSLILLTWACFFSAVQVVHLQLLTLGQLVSIHLLTSLFLALGFQIFLASNQKSLWIGNIVLHVFFPILGPFFVLTLVITLALSPKMQRLSDFHEEDAALTIQKHNSDPKSFGESIRYSLNVEPLVETIRSNANTDLKRGAIETLSNIRNPFSISLLKECLGDANSEVRFYASSGLARIEESLNANIIHHKKMLKKISQPTAKDYYVLAKAYYEFIYLSIQDEASLQYYLNQSIQNFEKAQRIMPKESKYLEALERAYIRAGRYTDARKLKQQSELSEHQNLMYMAESWFQEGQFLACREVLIQLHQEKDQNLNWAAIDDVIELWGLSPEKNAMEHTNDS